MKHIDVVLSDDQYTTLATRSRATGKSLDDLVGDAIDDEYGDGRKARLLQAIHDSAGTADPDDFDGLSGEEYVDMIRGYRACDCQRGRA